MNAPVYLDAFGALLPSGIYSPVGHIPWSSGQLGAHDVSREQTLDKPYPGFGKLQIADRLAFSVASLTLRHYENRGGENSGITLGIPYGSLSTDLRFMESLTEGFPSPALFSATLPSSPIADVAIYHGFKGPCRVISGNNASGLCAFEQALSILHLKKATTMLAISLYGIDPVDRDCPLTPQSLPKENSAYGFLLTSIKSNNGLNYRVNAHFDVPDAILPDLPGELYFDRLLSLMSNHQTGSSPFATQGYSGFISIEKDA